MTDNMSSEGQALLDEIKAIKANNKEPAKQWTPEQLLVISVRKSLKKSQPEFSRLLGVPIGTIRDWEQGRKQPDSAAITLIKVAKKNPKILEEIAA
ncbi:helix-turn-helix domain-containing protein [Porticoccus sp. GXU_MW_L64]